MSLYTSALPRSYRLPLIAVCGLLLAFTTSRQWLQVSGSAADGLTPVLAVVLTGPDAAGLKRLGLLSTLTQTGKRIPAWQGVDLRPLPGADGLGLWRRAVTGMIAPTSADPDLLVERGIDVVGSWDAPARPDLDRRQLLRLDGRLGREADSSWSAVLLLSCSNGRSGVGSPDCSAVFRQAVEVLRNCARKGGMGILCSIPAAGHPHRGVFWMTGHRLAAAAQARFRAVDLAPTLLYLLGQPFPPSIAGSPPFGLLSAEVLFHHPVRWLGGGS